MAVRHDPARMGRRREKESREKRRYGGMEFGAVPIVEGCWLSGMIVVMVAVALCVCFLLDRIGIMFTNIGTNILVRNCYY